MPSEASSDAFAPCPNCDASLHVITDCFSGHSQFLDNYDEIADYLREHNCLAAIPGILLERGLLPRDVDHDIPHMDKEGPFIVVSLVAREAWCRNDDCSYSQREYYPPHDGGPPYSLRD